LETRAKFDSFEPLSFIAFLVQELDKITNFEWNH